MERSIRRKRREDFRDRSMTPPPSLREVPHGANETTTEKQPEALEAPKNQQEETPRPTAVPRGEGEETEARTPGGKSLHLQGAPGSKSSQDRAPNTCSTPKGRYKARPTEEKELKKIKHNNPGGRSVRRRGEGAEKRRDRHRGSRDWRGPKKES